jgi:hypothetical protein
VPVVGASAPAKKALNSQLVAVMSEVVQRLRTALWCHYGLVVVSFGLASASAQGEARSTAVIVVRGVRLAIPERFASLAIARKTPINGVAADGHEKSLQRGKVNRLLLVVIFLLTGCGTNPPTDDRDRSREAGSSGPTVYGTIAL